MDSKLVFVDSAKEALGQVQQVGGELVVCSLSGEERLGNILARDNALAAEHYLIIAPDTETNLADAGTLASGLTIFYCRVEQRNAWHINPCVEKVYFVKRAGCVSFKFPTLSATGGHEPL